MVTCEHKNASEVGDALCKSPDVAAMSFTGSTRVGNFLNYANYISELSRKTQEKVFFLFFFHLFQK